MIYLCDLTPVDQQDKIVKVRMLADLVDEHEADAVVLSTESWIAFDSDETPLDQLELRAGERDDRQEVLLSVLMCANGTVRQIMSLIQRSDPDTDRNDTAEAPERNLLRLEAPVEEELDGYPLLAPIARVWERWASPEHD